MTVDRRRFDTVSFLSDYGTRDEFVGVVKSVIRDLAPHVTVLDLTHEIHPFDVRAGGLALARCIAYVPRGVVLGVVDPGSDAMRPAVAIEVAGGEGVLVGPDNGLLAPAVAMAGGAERAVVLTDASYHIATPGAAFAGRDVMAPVAAHLCNGVDLAELGELVDADGLVPATVPLPRPDEDGVVAEVLWVDRYGNCQLNLGPDDLDGIVARGDRVRLHIGLPSDPSGIVTRVATRADGTVAPASVSGGVGIVLDPYGMLALSIDRGSAADDLGIAAGDQVFVTAIGGDAGDPVATTPVRLGRS